MERNYSTFKRAAAISMFVFPALVGKTQITQTFSYTGNVQTFTVPSCVSTISVEAWGAQGWTGAYQGGKGGYAAGGVPVSAGQVLYIYVGGQGSVALVNMVPAGGGYNGGGNGQSNGAGNNVVGGGGGATDIRIGGTAFGNRVIVAGGGGGSTNNTGCYGGDGGGLIGVTGGSLNPYPPGTGGTQSAGGNAGGALGIGGSGNSTMTPWNGGGGGGYYGGGTASQHSGGGGGSSYIAGLTNSTTTAGVRSGHGLLTFTYNFNGNGVAASVSPTLICVGSSATLGASGMVSYTWSTGSFAASVAITPTATGSYTVQGTNSVNCVSSSVLTITVSPGLPVLSITSSTNQTCLGKTATLTASGALTYTWTGGVSNGVSFSPATTTTYVVTGENGCGTATAATAITVAPISVSASSSPTITCAGTSVTLTAVAPANGYTWQPYNLSGPSVITNPSVSMVYTVTVSDGTCSGVANVSVTALPIPTISVLASSSVVCAGYPVTFTANGGLSYTWTPGNLSGNTVTVFPQAATQYSVGGSNSVGCSSGTTQIVITNNSPIVNVTASSTFVCLGTLVNILATGNASSYQWTNGPPTNAYAVSPTSTTIYTVIGTAGNGCTTTKTISIDVLDPPILLTSSSSTVCSGTSVTLTASGAGGYLWDNNSIQPVTTVTPNITTIYMVTASTTSLSLTCSSTHTIKVNVNSNPTVTVSSSKATICNGESATLTAGGASNYTWNTGSNLGALVVSPTSLGFNGYTVTGSDANNCTKTASIQVKVNQCNAIGELQAKLKGFVIYPNPNNGEFIIEYCHETILHINNGLGQHIKTVALTADNNYKASVKGLAKGIYFISGEKGYNLLNLKIAVE